MELKTLKTHYFTRLPNDLMILTSEEAWYETTFSEDDSSDDTSTYEDDSSDEITSSEDESLDDTSTYENSNSDEITSSEDESSEEISSNCAPSFHQTDSFKLLTRAIRNNDLNKISQITSDHQITAYDFINMPVIKKYFSKFELLIDYFNDSLFDTYTYYLNTDECKTLKYILDIYATELIKQDLQLIQFLTDNLGKNLDFYLQQPEFTLTNFLITEKEIDISTLGTVEDFS